MDDLVTDIVADIWPKLFGIESEEKERTDKDWRSLTRDIADRKKVEPKRVQSVCQASGKTMADLQAAVKRVVRRRAARVAVEAGRGVAAERLKSEQRAAQADHTFGVGVQALRAKLDAERDLFAASKTRLDAIDAAAIAADAYLVESAELPQVVEELARLTRERNLLGQKIATAIRIEKDALSNAQSARAQCRVVLRDESAQQPFLSLASEQEAVAETNRTLAAEAHAARQQLQARIADLERQLREP